MNILLAAAHPDLRLSLELLLSVEPGVNIVGTASEGDGLLALINSTHPDVVISEWELGKRPLIDIIHETNQHLNPPQYIILTAHADTTQTAPEAGIYAFVQKGNPPDQLLTTFRAFRALTSKTRRVYVN